MTNIVIDKVTKYYKIWIDINIKNITWFCYVFVSVVFLSLFSSMLIWLYVSLSRSVSLSLSLTPFPYLPLGFPLSFSPPPSLPSSPPPPSPEILKSVSVKVRVCQLLYSFLETPIAYIIQISFVPASMQVMQPLYTLSRYNICVYIYTRTCLSFLCSVF